MGSLLLLCLVVFISPFILIGLFYYFGTKILFGLSDFISGTFHAITRDKFK